MHTTMPTDQLVLLHLRIPFIFLVWNLMIVITMKVGMHLIMVFFIMIREDI